MAQQLNLATTYGNAGKAQQYKNTTVDSGIGDSLINFSKQGLKLAGAIFEADAKDEEQKKKEQAQIDKENQIKKDAAAEVLYRTHENQEFDVMKATLEEQLYKANPDVNSGSPGSSSIRYKTNRATAKTKVEQHIEPFRKEYNIVYANDLRDEEQAYIDTNGSKDIRKLHEQYKNDPDPNKLDWMNYAGVYGGKLQSDRMDVLVMSSAEMPEVLKKTPLNYDNYNKEVGTIFREELDAKEETAIQHRVKSRIRALAPVDINASGIRKIVKDISGKVQKGQVGFFSDERVEDAVIGQITTSVRASTKTTDMAFRYMKEGLFYGGSGESLFNKGTQGEKWFKLHKETIEKFNSLKKKEDETSKQAKLAEKEFANSEYRGQDMSIRQAFLTDPSEKNRQELITKLSGKLFYDLVVNSSDSHDEFVALTEHLEGQTIKVGEGTAKEKEQVTERSKALQSASTKLELMKAMKVSTNDASVYVLTELNKMYIEKQKALKASNPSLTDPTIENSSKLAEIAIVDSARKLSVEQILQMRNFYLTPDAPADGFAFKLKSSFPPSNGLQNKERLTLVSTLEQLAKTKQTESQTESEQTVQNSIIKLIGDVSLPTFNLGKSDKTFLEKSATLLSSKGGQALYLQYRKETASLRKAIPKWESLMEASQLKLFIINNPNSKKIAKKRNDFLESKNVDLQIKKDFLDFEVKNETSKVSDTKKIREEKRDLSRATLTSATSKSIYATETLDGLDNFKITGEVYGEENTRTLTSLLGRRRTELKKKINAKADRKIEETFYTEIGKLRKVAGGEKEWSASTTTDLKTWLSTKKFSGDANGIESRLRKVMDDLSKTGANSGLILDEIENVQNAQQELSKYYTATEDIVTKLHKGVITLAQAETEIDIVNTTFASDVDWRAAIARPEEKVLWEDLKREEKKRLVPFIDKEFSDGIQKKNAQNYAESVTNRTKKRVEIIESTHKIINNKHATIIEIDNEIKGLSKTNDTFITADGIPLSNQPILSEAQTIKYLGLLSAKRQKIQYGDNPDWITTPRNQFIWHNEMIPRLKAGMVNSSTSPFERKKDILAVIENTQNELNRMFIEDKAIHPNDYDTWMTKIANYNPSVTTRVGLREHGEEYINSKFFSSEGTRAKILAYKNKFLDDGKALRGQMRNAFREYIVTKPIKDKLASLEYEDQLAEINSIVDSFFVYKNENEKNMSKIPGIEKQLSTYYANWRELLTK
jgi:hypothetical protein